MLLSWRIGLLFPYAAMARNGSRAANSARRFAAISALTVLLASQMMPVPPTMPVAAHAWGSISRREAETIGSAQPESIGRLGGLGRACRIASWLLKRKKSRIRFWHTRDSWFLISRWRRDFSEQTCRSRWGEMRETGSRCQASLETVKEETGQFTLWNCPALGYCFGGTRNKYHFNRTTIIPKRYLKVK